MLSALGLRKRSKTINGKNSSVSRRTSCTDSYREWKESVENQKLDFHYFLFVTKSFEVEIWVKILKCLIPLFNILKKYCFQASKNCRVEAVEMSLSERRHLPSPIVERLSLPPTLSVSVPAPTVSSVRRRLSICNPLSSRSNQPVINEPRLNPIGQNQLKPEKFLPVLRSNVPPVSTSPQRLSSTTPTSPTLFQTHAFSTKPEVSKRQWVFENFDKRPDCLILNLFRNSKLELSDIIEIKLFFILND